MTYRPPYKLTSAMIGLVAEIGERLGRTQSEAVATAPRLRKENRIRTIQATLQIEQNTLSLEQVTAVLEGKRVKGSAREIREVKNAFVAYERLTSWNPFSRKDLLHGHALLMEGLVERAGKLRSGGVGVVKGGRVVHMAPPAGRVSALVDDLLRWCATTDEHPLIASCVFHYEFEFIHPFADGNGRLGRLWQTLILSKWKPAFLDFPLESVVRDHQADYYRTLGESDKAGDSTGFVLFMLEAIRESLASTPQVAPQVTPQVERLLEAIGSHERSRPDLQERLGLADRKSFRERYLAPALEADLVEFTIPEKPNSRLQMYRLTAMGTAFAKRKADDKRS
ncbi:MAG: Fic family protein [Fibrobacteres bacterium]|nr:Fic family protein [Fibrobacterota bacterium]